MERRRFGLIAGISALLFAAGCSSDLADPASSTPPIEPTASTESPNGVSLPLAGPAGLVVSIPGDLDALIALHASARDELRACIDDHNQSSNGEDARRFPC